MIEASQLIALQALLTLLQPLRHRPTLKHLVQDQGNALANLREGDRRGPFFHIPTDLVVAQEPSDVESNSRLDFLWPPALGTHIVA